MCSFEEGFVEDEQDNEKEKEQFLHNLEVLRDQGTRELWQFVSFWVNTDKLSGPTGQGLCSCHS